MGSIAPRSRMVSEVTDLRPGRESVQVEEAHSPCVDGHRHYHQADDIDPQASFHLWDTASTHHSSRQQPRTPKYPLFRTLGTFIPPVLCLLIGRPSCLLLCVGGWVLCLCLAVGKGSERQERQGELQDPQCMSTLGYLEGLGRVPSHHQVWNVKSCTK